MVSKCSRRRLTCRCRVNRVGNFIARNDRFSHHYYSISTTRFLSKFNARQLKLSFDESQIKVFKAKWTNERSWINHGVNAPVVYFLSRALPLSFVIAVWDGIALNMAEYFFISTLFSHGIKNYFPLSLVNWFGRNFKKPLLPIVTFY